MKRAKKRKLTPKERVLREYPGSFCKEWFASPMYRFGVYSSHLSWAIGRGNTASAAWADAARRLK